MRYFATKHTYIAVACKEGRVVRWPTGDGIEGMLSVPDTDQDLLGCLLECIRTNTGGEIREVKQKEFDEWQKKSRNRPLFVKERETVGSFGAATDTLMPKVGKEPPPPAREVAADPPKRMESQHKVPPHRSTSHAPPAKSAPPEAPAPTTRRRGSFHRE